MSERVVVISAVEHVRSGTTNGHQWNIYKVTDSEGNDLGSCLDDVANAAKSFIGRRAQIVNEVERKEKDGKVYNNLQLRSVEPVPESQAEVTPDLAETPMGPHPAETESSPPPGVVDWDGKERRIVRQACLKAAVQLWSGVAAFRPPEIMQLAENFERWVYRPNVVYAEPVELFLDADGNDIPFGDAA